MVLEMFFCLFFFISLFFLRFYCIIVLGDMMRALITGASNGIGREMAIYLSELGYDLIVVARNRNELMKSQTKFFSHMSPHYKDDLKKHILL